MNEPLAATTTRHYRVAALMAATIVVVTDQLTKWWALNGLDGGRVIDVIWTLRLRLVYNTGAAFSTFSELGPLLGVAGAAVALVLLCSRRFLGSPYGAIAAGCIAGGALGNLTDRLLRSSEGFMRGAVIDFIDVQFWPVWNVADMGVVLGAGSLAWIAIRTQPTQRSLDRSNQ